MDTTTTPDPSDPGYVEVGQAMTATAATMAPAEPLHCMVDLETLGRRPYCPILSIGACIVDMQPVGLTPAELITDVFYVAIDLESCLDLGLKVDADTLKWWMGQADEAKRAAFNDEKAMKLPDALDAFTTWVNSRPLKVWGNSARFDLGILEAAYAACGKHTTPWHFTNERCYRTLKNLPEARGVELVRFGQYHNALDDAITQALHLKAINERLMLQL